MCRTITSTTTGTIPITPPPLDTGPGTGGEGLQGLQHTPPQIVPSGGVQALDMPVVEAPPLGESVKEPLTLPKPPRLALDADGTPHKVALKKGLEAIDRDHGADIAKEVRTILEALEAAKYLAPNPKAATQKLVHPSARGAVHELVAMNPRLLGEEARDLAVALLDKGAVAKDSNIREAFGESGAKDVFKTWFHGFSSTVNLLASRVHDGKPLPPEQQQKLLKAELMRGQLQATYKPGDAGAFGRSLSPLVAEGYGRGVRTGLWMAVKDMHEKTLTAALPKGALKDFDVFPVNRAFRYLGKEPVIEKGIPATLKAGECIYIEELGVQLVPKSLYTDKAAGRGEVDAHLGGLGLRNSPSECADILAAAMAGRIDANDPKGAIELLKPSLSATNSKQVQTALQKVELAPNTLLASAGTDPLTQSSKAQIQELREAFSMCALRAGEPGMPFYATQNFQVVKNLLGDIEDLGVDSMPSATCGALTDALQRAALALGEARAGVIAERSAPPMLVGDEPVIHDAVDEGLSVQRQAMNMEKFYQAMQDVHDVVRFQLAWTGSAPKLEDSIRALLPETMRAGATVASAPHALAMLDQVFKALPREQSDHTTYLKGAYYETAGVLGLPDSVDPAETVGDPGLRTAGVIVMEPHPNNAALQSIVPHDPVALIENVLGHGRTEPLTLVMDVTLNHLGDAQIQRALETAKPYIDSGVLNLVLLQSGTKFFQNGMDLASIGTAVVLNDKTHWTGFNGAMAETTQHVPDDDKGYIAKLLSEPNAEASRAYLDKVRANTALLRAALDKEIPLGHAEDNAFEVCANTDRETVYIAFKPTDAYLRRINEEAAKAQSKAAPLLDHDRRSELNGGVYKKEVLRAFGDLTAVDRSSFGFNITNFGECGETVRITLGIEDAPLLATYASRLLALGRELHGRPRT